MAIGKYTSLFFVGMLFVSLHVQANAQSDALAASLFPFLGISLVLGGVLAGFLIGFGLAGRKHRNQNKAVIEQSLQPLLLENGRLLETVKDLRADLASHKDTAQKAQIVDITEDTLHNLNSELQKVHLSASMVEKYGGDLHSSFLKKMIVLLEDTQRPPAQLLLEDEKGKMFLEGMGRVGQKLDKVQSALHMELKNLHEQIFRIHEIVAAQRRCTHGTDVFDEAHLRELMEDVLKIQETTMEEFQIKIVRRYEAVPTIQCSKIKLLHLFNQIIKNACQGLMMSEDRENRVLLVHICMKGEGRIRLEIQDNGQGIEQKNLTRIFAHGFSTWRRDGLGLHHCAAVMSEMGGMLGVKSMGLGTGASFVLEIPCTPKSMAGQITDYRDEISNIRNQ